MQALEATVYVSKLGNALLEQAASEVSWLAKALRVLSR